MRIPVLLACAALGLCLTGLLLAPSFIPRPVQALPFLEARPKLSDDFFARYPLAFRDAVAGFYKTHKDARLWDDKSAAAAIAILAQAGTHGLNPADYDSDALTQARNSDLTDVQNLYFDQLLTDASLRYARHVTGPRANLKSLGLNPDEWRKPVAADEFLQQLKDAPDKAAYLNALPLTTPLYKALQAALADLDKPAEERAALHGDEPVAIDRLVKPGQSHASVPALRARFGLPPDEDEGSDPNVYDRELAERVIAFQRDHGLKADAMLGPQTVAFLNQSDDVKRRQILVNLERLRWLPPEKPERYLVLNIPAATLWAVDKGQVVHEISVIVGRTERPTPILRTDVTGVRFHPTWTVPPTIKVKDYLPKLQADPRALDAKGIVITQKTEDGFISVNPENVDWNNITKSELASFRFTQPAGDNNALGLIRVLMPNDHGVYLHDTNDRKLFGTADLAVSSGCVRLSKPREIAEFVLNGNKGWSDETLTRYLDSGKTRDIMAENKFPVMFLYQTAWLHTDGKLVLGYDLYAQDAPLAAALEKP